MYLLILLTFLSFASVLTSYITKPILSWLKKPTKKERTIINEIESLREQQTQISMMDNFSQHAKIQRKINSYETELNNLANDKNVNSYVFQLGLTYGMKLLVSLLLFILVFWYRRTPVFIFPEYIDLYPLNYIISFPNNEVGSVSVHFWLIVSNSVARQIVR